MEKKKTEKDKEENIWKRKWREIFGEGRKIYFCEGEEKQQRKMRKNLEKENLFFVEEKKNEGGKYLEKVNLFFCGGEGKGKNIWRRNLFVE